VRVCDCDPTIPYWDFQLFLVLIFLPILGYRDLGRNLQTLVSRCEGGEKGAHVTGFPLQFSGTIGDSLMGGDWSLHFFRTFPLPHRQKLIVQWARNGGSALPLLRPLRQPRGAKPSK
jgi:hypothetical protein